MKFTVVLSTAVAVALSAGLALAGTPFGGDDTGFVAPDKATLHCEDGLSKKVGSLVTALIKCNIKDSDDQVKHAGAGTFDGAACQAQATGKWDTTTMAYVCPPCISKNGIRDLTVSLVNLNGGVVFCDTTSGTAQDAPDTGFVPNDKATAKCEDGAAKNAGKLTTAIGKCHVKASDNGFKVKPFDEEACEVAAKGKYDAAAAKLTSCPVCLNHGALRDLVENLLDSNNGDAYCASPSGAFLN
jgi:hypothetical protein